MKALEFPHNPSLLALLSLASAGKAVAIPLLLAGFLIFVMGRPHKWASLGAACAVGALGAFPLNGLLLCLVPAGFSTGEWGLRTASDAWLTSVAEAALPEEFAKGMCLLALLRFRRTGGSLQNEIIGALLGIGFALAENLGFALTKPEWRVMAVLAHASWGLIMGHLARRVLANGDWRWRPLAWMFVPPLLLHWLLDASIGLVEVRELRLNLGPGNPAANAALDPSLLLSMAMTAGVFLGQTVWAVRIIRALRQSDAERIEPRRVESHG